MGLVDFWTGNIGAPCDRIEVETKSTHKFSGVVGFLRLLMATYKHDSNKKRKQLGIFVSFF